jgi:hypothetical protein
MITSKVLEIKKAFVDHLPTRGEVAAQEQMRVFGQMFRPDGEPRTPRTRGEVAAQEQMRIFGHIFGPGGEPHTPRTRGEVAAQEQMRIMSNVTRNFLQNRNLAEAR